MGAPLATLSTVIKDKSTASIPFGSLACWLNALSWSAYGFIVADNIMVIFMYHYAYLLYKYILHIQYVLCTDSISVYYIRFIVYTCMHGQHHIYCT